MYSKGIKMSMANSLMRFYQISNIDRILPIHFVIRHGHIMRGKPPGVAKSLEQRLKMEKAEDVNKTQRVNIGFPQFKPSRSEQLQERLAHLKQQRADPDLERQARQRNLIIDLDKVEEEYAKGKGKFDLRTIADHYNIFSDLFGCAYFVPRVNLQIKYALDNNVDIPVYSGNLIKPAEARNIPVVEFDGSTDIITGKKLQDTSYWTLIATNPDGNFSISNAEYVHWFVANIPNGDVQNGVTHIKYLPPCPPKGIGYQRFIFVLYKQNTKLDFSDYKLNEGDSTHLHKRIFSTTEFYRKYQDVITPAGLAFYQTNWDKSITDLYHNVLHLKEPVFEYDFEKPYMADQKFFPLRQAFNSYLDKHRDMKDVNKQYLEATLAKSHPFDGPEQDMKFPAAHPIRNVPSWLTTDIRKKRLGLGRWADFKNRQRLEN